MKVDLTRLPEITNEKYLQLYNNNTRYLVLMGGAGSGKSVFAAQKIIYRIITEQNHRILVVRKVAKTIRNSVFSLFRDQLVSFGLNHPALAVINKTDMRIHFPAFNSEILFIGLDDVEKIKSITGITSEWHEEATEESEDDFNQLDLRMRGETKNYKQIMLSFNPISNLHWLKKRFFDTVPENTTVSKTTWRDNRFLDTAYVSVLENLKNVDKTYYQIYNLGEWGVLGNLVFSNWTVEDVKLDLNQFDSVYFGLDFGFNHPSAYIQVGFKDDVLYVYDEICERGMTNNQFIELIKNIHPAGEYITADSSRPDLILENNKAGLNTLSSKKGKDSVLDGIDFMKRFKIVINSRCQNTINEFQLYKWTEDKNGNKLEKPVDENDDLIDAARYALESKRQSHEFDVFAGTA